MRRSERVTVTGHHHPGIWNSITSTAILILTATLLINTAESVPINRQVGISENVYITTQNDTYGNEQRVCSIDSMTYVDGDSIPTSSPCEHCICRPPGFACTIISCEYRAGCKALKRSNQCCPEYQCECEKDGKIYQNGEKILDNNNPCEVCYCQGGDIICAVIDCYWRSDCQPRYIENRCCPLYDHCPQTNHPGPIRPTQRPLLTSTSTLGTTVGWFNLSSSIFASSSTPFAELEDLSSSTPLTPAAALVPSTSSVAPPQPAQESETAGVVPEVEQSQENSILPQEKLSTSSSPASPALVSTDSSLPLSSSTETPVVKDTPVEQQQQEISNSPINIIPALVPQVQTPEEQNVVETVKDKTSDSTSEIPPLSSSSPVSSDQLELESTSTKKPEQLLTIIKDEVASAEPLPEVPVLPVSSSPSSVLPSEQENQVITSSPLPPVVNVETAEIVTPAAPVVVVDAQDEPIDSSSLSISPSSSLVPVMPTTTNVVVVESSSVLEEKSPVEGVVTVQETQIPDLSSIPETLPESDSAVVASSSSSSSISDLPPATIILEPSDSLSQRESVTVANLEKESTIASDQPTETLDTVTVLNTVDIPASIVVESTQLLGVVSDISSSSSSSSSSGIINPSLASHSSLYLPSPSSSSLVEASVDQADDNISANTEFIPVAVSEISTPTPVLPSSSTSPIQEVVVDSLKESEPIVPENVSVVQPEIQNQAQSQVEMTTQVVPLPEEKLSVPSLELQPPSPASVAEENAQNEIILADPKPVVVEVEKPSLELQPPVHEPIVPASISAQENPSLDEPVKNVQAERETTILPASDDLSVTSLPELQAGLPSSSSLPSVVGNLNDISSGDLNDDPVVATTVASLALNDPVVTEIPSEVTATKIPEKLEIAQDDSLPLADSPAASLPSSSAPVSQVTSEASVIVPETESTLLQDQPASNDETVTSLPPSSSSSTSSPVVLADAVNEATDSAPVFDETPSDTLKANQQQQQQQPTVSPVSDDVTEVESLRSSTVPPTESPVKVSFSDLNETGNETPAGVTGEQIDSQDQADPTDEQDATASIVVLTTTPASVSPSSSSSASVDKDILADDITTISSISSSSSSSSRPPPPAEIVANDEPTVETTITSIVQSDEPVKVTEASVLDGVLSDGANTNTVSSIINNDDLPQSDDASVSASQSQGEVDTTEVHDKKSPSLNLQVNQDEQIIATTFSPIIIANTNNNAAAVQLNDESSSIVETTIKTVSASSLTQSNNNVDAIAQNDEPVIATTVLPAVANDDLQAEPTTVRQILADESSPSISPSSSSAESSSSESKFRLDPSVFTDGVEQNSNTKENSTPLPVGVALSSAALDQNNVNVNENDIIFDNIASPTTQLPLVLLRQQQQQDIQVSSESKSHLNNQEQSLLDEAEQIVTTEVNRRTALDDEAQSIDLTTTRSTLGEERRESFDDEPASASSSSSKGEEIIAATNTPALDSVKLSQDDNFDDVAITTETAPLLRHHHPYHVEETTTVPASSPQQQQQQQQQTKQDGKFNDDSDDATPVEATTVISNQVVNDESQKDDSSNSLEATTITILKHDFRSGLTSSDEEEEPTSSVAPQLVSNLSSTVSNVKSDHPHHSQNDESQGTTVTSAIFSDDIDKINVSNIQAEVQTVPPFTEAAQELRSDENIVVTTSRSVNDDNNLDSSDQTQSETTIANVQNDDNDDTIYTTTVVPNSNFSQSTEESRVNTSVKGNSPASVVVIPNELVKRLDPITDDLGQNGLGRSDFNIQSQMKQENADETWFWRAVNRVSKVLPSFKLSRQPRSTDTHANAQNLQSNQNNNKKAPHRPFLFW